MPNINYKNTTVHYTSVGKGNSIVFLHGFLENLTMWKNIIPHFIKSNRVICIDLLGHGKTGSLGYIHTMEEQAYLVKFILNYLKLRKYVLIGHSMGGYTSLAFAELFPQNIKGISLMNSTALPDTKEKQKNRERGIEAVKYNADLFVKMAIPNLFTEENQILFIQEIQDITKESLKISKKDIIASLEGMKIRKDCTFILRSELFPVMMIIGKKDPALDYQSLLDQVKNTSVHVVEFAAGHMSHIENKTELIDTLKKFIKLSK